MNYNSKKFTLKKCSLEPAKNKEQNIKLKNGK